MNVRTAAALAAALTVVGIGTAEAATKVKPLCNIVTDGTGDTFAARAQDGTPAAAAGPQEAAFDIKSADIASDGKVVTAVIRLAGNPTTAQTAPEGTGFSFDFLLPSSEMSASLRAVLITGQAPYFEATYKDPSIPNSPSTFLGTATGSVDTKKNEVHITAPVALFSVLGPMTKNTLIQPAPDAATSGRAVPPSPGVASRPVATRFVFADVATDSKTIRVGAASCVVPGK